MQRLDVGNSFTYNQVLCFADLVTMRASSPAKLYLFRNIKFEEKRSRLIHRILEVRILAVVNIAITVFYVTPCSL